MEAGVEFTVQKLAGLGQTGLILLSPLFFMEPIRDMFFTVILPGFPFGQAGSYLFAKEEQ